MNDRRPREELLVVDTSPPGAGGFFSSYYVDSGEGLVLVDPGPTAGLPALIAGAPPRVDYIFVTHVHLDHVGAAGAAGAAFDAPIYVHPRGARHIRDPRRLWKASLKAMGWLAVTLGPPSPGLDVREAQDGSRVGGCSVVHTPGHAPHHASLLCGDLLFPGDSIAIAVRTGQGSVLVPTLMPPVDLEGYMSSLDRQEALGASQAALPHYGVWELPGLLEEARAEAEAWARAARRACSSGRCRGLDVIREAADLSRTAARAVAYAESYSAILAKLVELMAEGLASWASAEA